MTLDHVQPSLSQAHSRTDSQMTLVEGSKGGDERIRSQPCDDVTISDGKCWVHWRTEGHLTDDDDQDNGLEGDDDQAGETHDVHASLLPREQLDISPDNLMAQMKRHGREEGVLVAKLVLPISLAGLLELVLSFMNVFALGHLGKTELAAGSLGATFVNVTGFAFFLGMNTAFDTLGSQIYSGSRDPFALGVMLQRALLVNLLMMIPIAFVWAMAEPILVLLGQELHISKLAGMYCIYNLPSVVLFPLMDTFRRFLAVQGLTTPPTIMFGIGLPLHALFNYLFIIHESTSFGLLGAPLANTCTNTAITIMFFIYFQFFFHNRVWNGFSVAAFQSITQYVRIGLPGIAMVCTDWWAWDLVTIISGWFGETTLAAQSVVLTTYLVFFQVPHGVGSGANARIGNLLGSQCPQLAKLSTVVIQMLGAAITGVLAVVTYFGRFYIARAFTDDPHVIQLVTDAMLIVSFLVFADGAVSVALGILRGCGMQTTGAILLFCGYYVVGIPLGAYFAIYGVPFVSSTGLGLVGLYSGLMASLVVMLVALSLLLLNLDWDVQVLKSRQRIQHAHSASIKSPLGYGFIPNDNDEHEPLLSP